MKSKTKDKIIFKITVKRLPDNDPDLSFLDGSRFLPHNPNNWSHVSEEDKEKVIAEYGSLELADEHYAEQDRKRLESYGGTWDMIGIVAEAEIGLRPNRLTRRAACGRPSVVCVPGDPVTSASSRTSVRARSRRRRGRPRP